MNFENIELFVRKKLGEDTSGHDFYHCFRVRTTAEKLAHNEGNVDMTVVICASLLHDVPDVKICKDVEKTKKEIIEGLIEEKSEARIFEIISYTILKNHYKKKNRFLFQN